MIIIHQLQYTYLYTTGAQIIQVGNVFSFYLTCMSEEEPIMGFVFKPGGPEAAGLDQSQPSLCLVSCWRAFEQSAGSLQRYDEHVLPLFSQRKSTFCSWPSCSSCVSNYYSSSGSLGKIRNWHLTLCSLSSVDLQLKTNPQRACYATSLLLTEKKEKAFCVCRHVVQIHGGPYC